ncbi:hypothetical protein BJX62DRAFT_208822 [Aspergillus germanicus]
MGNQEGFRAIALRPEDRILFEDVDLHPRLQKSSTACLACRKRRRKVWFSSVLKGTISDFLIV